MPITYRAYAYYIITLSGAYRGRQKIKALGKIRYLWNCSIFFHQIYRACRGGFRPYSANFIALFACVQKL